MSSTTKPVVLLALTIPWEDRIGEAQERKRAQYADLAADCQRIGLITLCNPVEVGCGGFAGQSLP